MTDLEIVLRAAERQLQLHLTDPDAEFILREAIRNVRQKYQK